MVLFTFHISVISPLSRNIFLKKSDMASPPRYVFMFLCFFPILAYYNISISARDLCRKCRDKVLLCE